MPQFLGNMDAPGWVPGMKSFAKNYGEPWDDVFQNMAQLVREKFGLSG